MPEDRRGAYRGTAEERSRQDPEDRVAQAVLGQPVAEHSLSPAGPSTQARIGRHDLGAFAGETFDLIVVGGGITGAGVVRHAAQAGLRTLLLEADDFAAGTSSRSTKLIHGGLRYLAMGDVAL